MKFEESMKELESVIAKMEDPNTSFEQLVKLYEKGIELSNFCTQTIKNAEAKITKLKEGKEEVAD
ncbi:MAG: exodeoxyribonuclease VII small subunit [Christensenellales bacterium]